MWGKRHSRLKINWRWNFVQKKRIWLDQRSSEFLIDGYSSIMIPNSEIPADWKTLLLLLWVKTNFLVFIPIINTSSIANKLSNQFFITSFRNNLLNLKFSKILTTSQIYYFSEIWSFPQSIGFNLHLSL